MLVQSGWQRERERERERVSGLIRLTKRRACSSSQVDRERGRDFIERKRA